MLDLGAEHQMVLELCPALNPNTTYSVVGAVTSLADVSVTSMTTGDEG